MNSRETAVKGRQGHFPSQTPNQTHGHTRNSGIPLASHRSADDFIKILPSIVWMEDALRLRYVDLLHIET